MTDSVASRRLQVAVSQMDAHTQATRCPVYHVAILTVLAIVTVLLIRRIFVIALVLVIVILIVIAIVRVIVLVRATGAPCLKQQPRPA